ncbi:hypothetical protein MRS44_016967 [Fusarium solani]|uniref:uncharacterized protein n=1 Tax=Fusarium solani TaxID=169388 RepID=UPI0032C49BBF|nr:hypothetical protein MRS44_016967 [Fusarium solani]
MLLKHLFLGFLLGAMSIAALPQLEPEDVDLEVRDDEDLVARGGPKFCPPASTPTSTGTASALTVGKSCKCPGELIKKGDDCVCPDGQIKKGKFCKCPHGQIKEGNHCKCPDYEIKKGDHCVCQKGYHCGHDGKCKKDPY